MNFSIRNAQYFNKGIWHVALSEHNFFEGTFAIHANYLGCFGQTIDRFSEKQNGGVVLISIDKKLRFITWCEFSFIQNQLKIVELERLAIEVFAINIKEVGTFFFVAFFISKGEGDTVLPGSQGFEFIGRFALFICTQ